MKFNINSVLEIEFETHFKQFFMPTIRGSDKGSKKRYAGLIEKNNKNELVFKGLETVRSDWTQLAKNFQQTLYLKIFTGQAFQQYIIDLIAEVKAGQCDELLVYKKRLRRRLEDYQRKTPPHVQAARKLQEHNGIYTSRGSWVEYVLTVNGAEPYLWHTKFDGPHLSLLDYDAYIERQLKPIADSILPIVGSSFCEITALQLLLPLSRHPQAE